jgi:HK97 family phage major capsid protein
MATTITTSEIDIPDQILDPFMKRIQHGSSIAQLSTPEPMKFGRGTFTSFDTDEAEYVGEGANKGPSDVTSSSKTILPFKFQKTVRFTNEVQWADEDHQLEVIQTILNLIPRSLSRALDYGVIHAVNPKTLSPVTAMTSHGYLAQAAATKAAGADIIADLDWAYASVLTNGYVPNGVALAPALAVEAVTARNNDQVKLFPEFRPTTEASSLDAFRASTSNTVSAANSLLAVAGDFDAVRWGVQRSIGLEMIEFGDPDGQGDLKRTNEVAFRAEIVYGWGIADLAAFALLTGTADSSSSSSSS